MDDIWIGEASLKTRLHRRNWGMLVDCDLAIEFANASAGTETAARCRARNSPCSPGSLARVSAGVKAPLNDGTRLSETVNDKGAT
ncbi:hypothetical protein, partial [Burkholderia sp. BDU5]|uniref:hypothetical protein n=1 Tax=Burkholderia sp. BDU5 TaxID=1385590 RepID=UPI001E382D7E